MNSSNQQVMGLEDVETELLFFFFGLRFFSCLEKVLENALKRTFEVDGLDFFLVNR